MVYVINEAYLTELFGFGKKKASKKETSGPFTEEETKAVSDAVNKAVSKANSNPEYKKAVNDNIAQEHKENPDWPEESKFVKFISRLVDDTNNQLVYQLTDASQGYYDLDSVFSIMSFIGAEVQDAVENTISIKVSYLDKGAIGFRKKA